MMTGIGVGVAFAAVGVGWVYKGLKPPPPKAYAVSSPRVKLSDGRHLAYKEVGVPKEEAQYKIIVSHGYDDSKDMHFPASQELIEELKLYFLFYDRAGYGESDPHPSRSVKTEAFDIQELADKLQLGPKFYIIGCSLGAYPIWSCLKYIPHRLLGAALVVPFVNYWWPSVPSALSKQSFRKLPQSFQWIFGIAHYTPWLYHWWTRKKFPSTVDEGMFTDSDLELLKGILLERPDDVQKKIKQQGERESVNRDILAAYGKWEFDPIMELSKIPGGCVHMWQGSADRVIPIEFNHFVAQKLGWIKYHEIPDAGHMLVHEPANFEVIVRALVADG
ncbi:uncharacterized protein LOC111012560 [Momordica charantia]|uniref:Uncharacterized protein LOC111012560 n=1 Tax=Momordica charantia TaxID=3673 RepID=A0A6J1CN82_MOMCH|nr:uncharacterized protein LOC111012560 [Momordica charantia]XP_022142423.1 uncharacterized protein LOC111012560 [Momordica charantia]